MPKKSVKEEINKDLKKLKQKVIQSADTHPTLHENRTAGQRAADSLTKWMGSWTFIILFAAILFFWVGMNGWWLVHYAQGDPFDPFPFILLNLVLSCLAAVQAPIIMMSQNRQSQKDRIRAEYDYAVNRKAARDIKQIIEEIKNLKRK